MNEGGQVPEKSQPVLCRLDSPQLPPGDEGRHFRKGFAFRPPPCQNPPRESLARVAKEGLQVGAAEGLTAVEVGRGPCSIKGMPGAGCGQARALSAASWSVLSALLFEDCSAS
ncbi:hypothetical protein E2C01_061307 [Portunus trituberculatus]|uniref:Uncharacterized protein n=1 Tax=Portunus trituberculatus TaxID=210409 RepID=A0A5B7H3I1_PORTR|nr:hypothetical protein [Portunus trituberculatus]